MKTKIRLSQLLVIGCFFGFFLFCLVWGLAQPDRPSSAAENRSLAQRPAMRRVVTDFGGFAKDFESYAADQFPDREQLIGVYTALELAQGKKFARKAYCLQDSWLLTKLTPTKPADLSALQQALAQAGALDRPLVWCVLPLKNEALYDLEPAYFSDETGETNKQALTAALAQVEGLTVIDAEAPLVTGTLADRERYFYKTDFHWNARGAFAAAQEIARQLAGAGTIAETSVPQAEAFLWSELGGERRYQGDLNVWFSNQFSMQEDIPRYVPKNAADLRYFLHPGDIGSVPRETIVGSGLDKDPVTYTTFLPTTSATTAWKTPTRRRPRPCSSSRIPSRTRRSTIFPPSSAPSQSSTRAATRRRRTLQAFWTPTGSIWCCFSTIRTMSAAN